MANETEYKGFTISLRLQNNEWTATNRKVRGAPLLVNLPSRNGRHKQSLDTSPQDSAIKAIRVPLDMIDCGGVL